MTAHKNGLLTIGKAARSVGVAASALRYYEKRNLLVPSVRSGSGYRMYNSHDLDRLQFILSAQAVGFTLADIRTLLDLQTDDLKSCKGQVQHLIERRLAEVDHKMKDLKRVKRTLGQALDRCRSSSGECMVLAKLSTAKNDRRKT